MVALGSSAFLDMRNPSWEWNVTQWVSVGTEYRLAILAFFHC
jgi:hypothetical protein